jgi:hypothetical protein
MWLTGRLIPDHKTIADFRKDSGPAIKRVCVQFVELCRLMGLLTNASVADGSKFKAVNTATTTSRAGRWSDAAPNWRRAWRGILRSSIRLTGRSHLKNWRRRQRI